MAGLAVVVPFPVHRVRRQLSRRTQIFAALFDEARAERAQHRLLVGCTLVVALLGAALEFAVG